MGSRSYPTRTLEPRKLTKRSIEAIQPPETGAVLVRDTVQTGFGVRVTSAGRVTFFFEAKLRGRTKRWSLGRFGPMTVDQARRKALKFAGLVAQGEDPEAQRKAAELAGRTLREAVEEYLATRDLKERTRKDLVEVLGRNVGDWMNRPVTEITRDEVLSRYRKVAKRAPAQASLTFRYLRAVLGFVEAAWRTPDGEPLLRENPVRVLSAARAWKKLQPRRRVIEPHELKPWFRAVLSDPDPRARDFFQFVILTGARRGEALGLTWDQVDLQGGKVVFTDTKARRDHVLPMGPYLWQLLKHRRKEAGDPWVFSQRTQYDRHRPDEPLRDLRFALERIRKASGVEFTAHDLRRTFATVAESLDLSAYAVKALLNHALPRQDVTAGYLRLTLERLREAMEKIEARILTLAGIKPGADVIRFPAAAEATHER